MTLYSPSEFPAINGLVKNLKIEMFDDNATTAGCESVWTQPPSTSTVCYKFYASKKTWDEGSKNYSNEVYTYHESCAQSIKNEDSQKTTLIHCLTILSLLILFFLVMLVIFVKKGLICRENNQNVITHKNDLYGNLTN